MKKTHKYLESKIVQNTALEFFKRDKAFGAICHGVLVLARKIDLAPGRSVL